MPEIVAYNVSAMSGLSQMGTWIGTLAGIYVLVLWFYYFPAKDL